MLKHLYILFLLAPLVFSSNGYSQYSEEEQLQVDSISKFISSSTNDLKVVESYINLYGILHVQNLDTILPLAQEVVKVSERNLSETLSKKDKIAFKKCLATAISDIGYVYDDYGRIKEATEHYYKALKIQEEINDQDGISSSLNNLGFIYANQDIFDKALELYLRSLAISEDINDSYEIAINLGNIAAIYRETDRLDLALEYYTKSLNLKDPEDMFDYSNGLNSIGVIYVQQEKLDSAKKYLFEALKNREEIGDEEGVALSLINISEYYVARKNITKAKESAERAYEICKELGLPEDVEMSAEMLSQIHKDLKNYKEGWGFYEVYIETRDSLRSKENITGIVEQNAQFDFDKKQAVNEAEHKKDLEISKEKEKNQQFITFAVVVILLLVIISLIIILKRLKITRKQKEVIEYQKQEIVDSITYAKRIQEAILPTESFIKEQLPNSFVYYKPKDIIAGDFYWVEAYTPKDKTESPLVLFAAADCTGHGVPGAMVSVVCNNALNAAVREHKLIDPGQILDKTREIVVEQFNKSRTTTISNIRDGMDIALCALNIKTNEIHYSGAFNPLWILRSGTSELEELKAARQSIGKVDTPKSFKTSSSALKKGDQIYLFSDGYADQFGGQKGKKMMRNNFKKLLLSIGNESMENQKKEVNSHFKQWKGNLEQIDDVCVMGVRI